jgi:hypothetical protein
MHRVIFATATLCLLISHQSQAELVTYRFTGSIESMYEADCSPDGAGGCSWTNTDVTSSSFYSPHEFNVGDEWSATYTWDTESPRSGISDDGAQGIYSGAVKDGSVVSTSFEVPSAALPKSFDDSLSVTNNRNFGGRVYDALSISQAFATPDWFFNSQVFLIDNTGTIYNDLDIPAMVALDDFDGSVFRGSFVNRQTSDQLQIRMNLTSATRVVPIPAAAWLFGSALIGLVGVTRHQSSKV